MKLRNHDAGTGGSDKPVKDPYAVKKSGGLNGFNLEDYAETKNTPPQQYDTNKIKETIESNEAANLKDEQRASGEFSKVEAAQAMMLLFLIDKLVSGICGFISTTFDGKKYSVSKEERAELVEYAGPVAAEILDKFSPAVLLLIGLGSLYGPKFGQAINDRREMQQKSEKNAPEKPAESK